ncbi:MAG: hypothetical protein ACXWLR_04375, partial [Myxococcales bacterium]
MRRTALVSLLLALPSIAAAPAREPFGNAHVSLMARVQAGNAEPRLAEVDVWADGARLRARIRGEPGSGEFWIDGPGSPALWIVGGKMEQARRRTLEHALQLSLAPAPSPAHANTDRIAGRPCKVVTEALSPSATLTRCMWRGLPLSVELRAKGFSFNAGALLVEEGAVTPADLQPPPGAPAAPA